MPSPDTAAQLFVHLKRLHPEAPAAFLDSSDHGLTPRPETSRRSILAFSLGDGAALVRTEGREAFFSWLRSAWPAAGTGTGWVGVLGYEYRATFFRVTHAVVVDHETGSMTVHSPDGGSTDWEQTVQTAAQQRDETAAASPLRLTGLTVRDSREEYLATIGAAQQEIRDGNSYEVCLTTAVTGILHGDGWQAYRQLREHNRAPFTQYLRLPEDDGGTEEILSTSPERFLSIDAGGQIRSEPIKGTRPRGATPEQDRSLAQDLLTHPKDRAENVMITDLVRNDLSVHAVPGTLRTERLCTVESYPTVHQMVSTISAQLAPGVHPADVVDAAFPPGSMTGAPKISTMEILRRLESGPRGFYSGVAGHFAADGSCDLSVLIRTAVLTRSPGADHARFHLGLGGAITADSEPAAEWEEVQVKSRGVLGALGARFPGP